MVQNTSSSLPFGPRISAIILLSAAAVAAQVLSPGAKTSKFFPTASHATTPASKGHELITWFIVCVSPLHLLLAKNDAPLVTEQ